MTHTIHVAPPPEQATQDAPCSLDEWLVYVHLHTVDTPPNANCFYFAHWGIKMPKTQRLIRNKVLDLKEANVWKKVVSRTLLSLLDTSIGQRLIQPATWLHAKGIPVPQQADSQAAQMREQITDVLHKSAGHTAPRTQWASTEEIQAAAAVFQEPLMVIHNNDSDVPHFHLFCPEHRLDHRAASGHSPDPHEWVDDTATHPMRQRYTWQVPSSDSRFLSRRMCVAHQLQKRKLSFSNAPDSPPDSTGFPENSLV